MVHGGCDLLAEDGYSFIDDYSFMIPDPTIAFVGDRCCLTLDFLFVLDYDYIEHIVIFASRYFKTLKLFLKDFLILQNHTFLYHV
jgi:hypothetical protein